MPAPKGAGFFRGRTEGISRIHAFEPRILRMVLRKNAIKNKAEGTLTGYGAEI